MTLTSALKTANSALAATSQQVSVVSRNISGVGDPNYVRRNPALVTGLYGTTRVETQRQIDQSVLEASLLANANASRSNVVLAGLNRSASLQSLNDFSGSPARMIEQLRQALSAAAAAPSDPGTTASLVESARSISDTINQSQKEILSMRAEADKAIASGVERVNTLLAKLEEVNAAIVQGTRSGADVFDNMDTRDRLLSEISNEIGFSMVHRADNDIMLVASNGVLLFETNARTLTFERTPVYSPGATGGTVLLDGVPIHGPNSSLKVYSGAIAGNIELRDSILTTYEAQLNEVARGLVETFAETDQSGSGNPPLAGLFTWSGGPTVPASGVLDLQIASSLSINALVDPQQGGNPALIRDGGINGNPDYIYNTDGGAGYSDRLLQLAELLDEPRAFAPEAGLSASSGLADLASASLDWLSGKRQSAAARAEHQSEMATHFKNALLATTGPNLDYEISHLLEVERAYQASAKVLSAVDDLLRQLIDVV